MRNNSKKSNIKHLCISLFMLVLFLCIIIAVNIMVDPANILRNEQAQNVAHIMAAGENASNITNLDDRRMLSHYAQLRQEPIDILGLGSSRVMQLSQGMVSDTENYFCAGVTGSDLRDCIENYFLFSDKVNVPNKVVLVTEYWYLSEGNFNPKTRTEYYSDFCESINSQALGITSPFEKYFEFASFSYFQSSLKSLLHADNHEIIPTRLHEHESDLMRSDGSYSYNQEFREGGVEQSNRFAIESTVLNNMSYNFTGVNSELQFQFESFIDKMLQDGTQVELLLVPIHPIYFDHMQSEVRYEEILSTEEYFRQVASEHNISVIGSYNPHVVGFDESDFYDAMHITDAAMQELYANG